MTSEKTLAERYGRTRTPNPRKRTIWITTIVVIVAALLVWWIVALDVLGMGPSVSYRDLAYKDLTATSVTVTFEVSATPGHEVACAVQAQNQAFAVVGWKVFTYPASQTRIRTFSETITTSEPATTGLVAHCWLT